jgi:hypothetical protein
MSSDHPREDVGNPSPETESKASEWKLEESSIWWLTYFWEPGKLPGWFSNPGNILMLTSVPFFAGAYVGYRMPTERFEDLIQGSVGGGGSADGVVDKRGKTTSAKRSKVSIKAVDQDAIKVVAARTASKALRIATLGTVGTFGFLGAMGFYMSGYKSLEEAVAGTTTWASSWGKSLEHAMGGDEAASKTHPEVLATKRMKEDEELRYIYDKYIKEECDDDKDLPWHDDDDSEKNKKASPTLYSVYEKYFKKEDEKS